MVRLEHPGFGVGPAAQLVADHEGDDPRPVRLVRQQLQVVHQRRVLGEARRDAQRPRRRRRILVVLPARQLDAPLDVADRIEVRADLDAVARPEAA